MALTKSKKNEVIEKLQKVIKESKSMVFVNFHKLTVASTTALRRKLRENKVGYVVAKKTLMKKVLSEAGIKGDLPSLDGELAVAYGTDLTVPAREVYQFQKKAESALSILGGVFEGGYMNKMEMEEIASIPPLSTLYAQFVHIINSPIQKFAVVLDAIAKKS